MNGMSMSSDILAGRMDGWAGCGWMKHSSLSIWTVGIARPLPLSQRPAAPPLSHHHPQRPRASHQPSTPLSVGAAHQQTDTDTPPKTSLWPTAESCSPSTTSSPSPVPPSSLRRVSFPPSSPASSNRLTFFQPVPAFILFALLPLFCLETRAQRRELPL